MTKNLLCLLGLAVGIGVLGCGSKAPGEASAVVTGKVTLAGKPLPGGTINFRSTVAIHRLGTGIIQADGSYEAKDVPQGPCKVYVENNALKPMDKGYTPPVGASTPPPGTKWVPIPNKYTSEATTDLTTTVTGDKFTYDVDLK